ncbi:SRPBCC domain-containing protein [Pseudonocardia sp. KRD-184]|uniref:SRPBCC domain-containing protein n=1 Tax=Pseudonocardia oceani TaxID=2792013 RepID=A0ABS6UAW9_9PSEU|nr:SRPBCC domain-containing protein [Pseudonocardia oceani]MBW0089556.1 SRPBCC domain-containing protein [Pseudonocardia oceani]MBW0096621.1 SRPBCC domain-containing protein [Pseudonocardia oceani]MBW0109312.1 SRPBCC domain-containing protein [Pseudonocardia oceani]MBW0123477.1 SRPBCC domain-containing protein [Pseudonocardia oceani]MBW0129380.1 SRPBCC domain-containing protein [Pseudonocardia oceani]
MSAPREIVLRKEFPDPVDDVWSAVTDSERLGRWFGTYTGRGRVGGTVEFTVTGEVDAGGEVAQPVTVTIHECDAPRRLVVDIPEDASRSWRVAVDIEPAGTGAVLVFTQAAVEGLDDADIAAGWRWYLDRLEASMHGTEMPQWQDYVPSSEGASS